MQDSTIPKRPASYDKAVALVLQGGGALGSYQAGVFEGLAQSEYPPDWIAGISIGAINAALIAGNPPEKRVERLRAFWEEITGPSGFWPAVPTGDSDTDHRISALHAVLLGQPGFFSPRPPVNWLLGKSPTSFYDTMPLRATLERLVDFNLINTKKIRFSVGAVNVRSGNLIYFDNTQITIRPEHVMASGALPPGFPAIEIDGEPYWDGGMVSNTPLLLVMDESPRRSRLTFQVDVFHASGPVPTNLEEVSEREKDIRYSSRTRIITEMFRTRHDLRHNLNVLLDKVSPELHATPEGRFLHGFRCHTTMDIAQLIYRPVDAQGYAKDYEFSRATMRKRWAAGLADARTTLRASPWLAPMPPATGTRVFDVVHDQLQSRPQVRE